MNIKEYLPLLKRVRGYIPNASSNDVTFEQQMKDFAEFDSLIKQLEKERDEEIAELYEVIKSTNKIF